MRPTPARIGIALVVLGVCGCGTPPPTSFQGVVECDEETLACEVAGLVRSVPVAEGQRVAAGTPLIILDGASQRLAVAEADAQVALAVADLARARAGARASELAAARADAAAAASVARLAVLERTRLEGLHAQALASDQDLDRGREAAERASAEAAAAAARLTLVEEGPRAEDVAVAEARLAAARATAARSAERLARCELLAPPGPRVIRHIHLHPGELAQPGVAAITVADLDRPYIDAFVPQAALAGVHLGGQASIRVDGATLRHGVVERIGERLEFTPRYLFGPADRPTLVARVRVRVGAGEALPAGVPADVVFAP